MKVLSWEEIYIAVAQSTLQAVIYYATFSKCFFFYIFVILEDTKDNLCISITDDFNIETYASMEHFLIV